MPDFLDKFINTTLPDTWDKIKDWWSELTEESSNSEVYIVTLAVTVVICIFLAIVVHNANKRDRQFRNLSEPEAAKGKEAKETMQPSAQVSGGMNSVERAIARADFESIMNEEGAEAKTPESITDKIEESADKAGQPFGIEKPAKVTSPILMEKIEIVRAGSRSGYDEDNGRMTFDTSRTGKTYTEKELSEIIK